MAWTLSPLEAFVVAGYSIGDGGDALAPCPMPGCLRMRWPKRRSRLVGTPENQSVSKRGDMTGKSCFRAGSPMFALARVVGDNSVRTSGRPGNGDGTKKAQTCSLDWQSTARNPWQLLARKQA